MSTAKQSVVDEIVAALLAAATFEDMARQSWFRAKELANLDGGIYLNSDASFVLRVDHEIVMPLSIEALTPTTTEEPPPDNRLPGSV